MMIIIVVDIVQKLTPFITLIGLILLWWQTKQQAKQIQSDRLLSLYQDLASLEARDDRKYLYTQKHHRTNYKIHEASPYRTNG